LKAAPFTEPWDIVFGQRYASMMRKSRRVAYFYDQKDNSTFRYRVSNPCQTLNACSLNWSASFFFLDEQKHFESIVCQADIIVICRAKYSIEYATLISIIRSRGKTVLYDVDDLVFDIDLAHYIANNNAHNISKSPAINDWFAYFARISVAMRMCDGAITTNEFLADQIRQRTGLPATVLPNYLNQAQLDYSHLICEHKLQQPDCGKFRIGYFSGSPSHEHDFAIAKDALNSLLVKHDHVELLLVGYLAHKQDSGPLKNRIKTVPFHDYVNLQRVIGSIDLNIAPLQRNIFTNCKSELKLFEASVVLTPTLATPTYTFSRAIEKSIDGFLADDMDWFEQLENIVTMPSSSLAQVASNSRQKCLERYSWDRLSNEILRALGQTEEVLPETRVAGL